MIWIPELTTLILALESSLRFDSLQHLIKDLAGRGGDIFDWGIGFEGQDCDLGCWVRVGHFG